MTTSQTARRPTECNRCHSPYVRWHQTKAGRWVLMNTTGNAYEHEYMRGPHGQTCTARTAQTRTS